MERTPLKIDGIHGGFDAFTVLAIGCANGLCTATNLHFFPTFAVVAHLEHITDATRFIPRTHTDTGGRVDGAVGIARQRSGLVTGVVFCACIDIEHEQGTVACLIVFEDAIATCGRGSGDARRRIDGAVGVTLEVAGCVCGAVVLAGSHIKKEC